MCGRMRSVPRDIYNEIFDLENTYRDKAKNGDILKW